MLPHLKSLKREHKTIESFGGINKCCDIKSGELAYANNMCSDSYPCLSSRKERKIIAETSGTINGVGGSDNLFFTGFTENGEGIYLCYDGKNYDYTQYSSSADFTLKRSFATLADSILIIPDNVVFYTNSATFSKICVSQTRNFDTALSKFHSESADSPLLDSSTIRYIASLTHNSISARSVSYSSGGTRTFYYCNFDQNLKPGDVITVKADVYSDYAETDSVYRAYQRKMKSGITLKIKDCTTVTHTTPSGSVTETVALTFDDNTVDTGGYKNVRINVLSIERGIPNLKDICAFNNRVWGITDKEIYTSKLGDPTEWNDFSTDSYGTLPYACFTTSAQTEGIFTAICAYGNFIYAFKENSVHKVYGSSPDEYTLYTANVCGAGKNFGKTVSQCGDTLIYAGAAGIYKYSDNFPEKISENISDDIAPICASAYGGIYYLLCEENGSKYIYTYDKERHIWHRQNTNDTSLFVGTYDNTVYVAEKNRIISLNGGEGKNAEKSVSWSFKISPEDNTFTKRAYGRLAIRYSLGKDSSFTVRALYNDGTRGAVCGAQYDETAVGGGDLYMPLRRCMKLTLEFRGTGEFLLRALKLSFHTGSSI